MIVENVVHPPWTNQTKNETSVLALLATRCNKHCLYVIKKKNVQLKLGELEKNYQNLIEKIAVLIENDTRFNLPPVLVWSYGRSRDITISELKMVALTCSDSDFIALICGKILRVYNSR